jgi:transposase
VLVTAWEVAKSSLPAYSHRTSPKKFTQHQLFACLVLKAFLKTDYRGLVEHLCDCPDWCQAIELAAVPHFTTIQKSAQRLLRTSLVASLLDQTVIKVMGRKKRVPLAAIDSTGMESRHSSQYFIQRRSREPNVWQTSQYTRYPKLGILVDCSNHLILGYLTDQGPKPDIRDIAPTLRQTSCHVKIEWLTADAGYDSEANHVLCREEHGIRSLFPPKHGRPTSKPARGRYRRLMQIQFNLKKYRQRWQVETTVSMIKRRLGSATTGRSYHARRRDLMLMVLTHNIMILIALHLLRVIMSFLQSSSDPFCRPPLSGRHIRRWQLAIVVA